MSFKRIRRQTWYCTLCFRNEVENDPTNLEGISVLKKSAKRRTAAGNGLAYAIFGCNELRQSLWMLFLQKIEDDAKCITEKRLTYLNSTSNENLVNFNWLCITNEMLRFQPLLMDVLLSVSTPRRNIDNDDHYKSSNPELGLIYGILMKRRYKDLSRIQRFIAIALADEKVHQKVMIYLNLWPSSLTKSLMFQYCILILFSSNCFHS